MTKPLPVEYTILREADGVRLILRYEGRPFDFSDPDTGIGSFRQYIVTRVVTLPESRKYILTTGYNRNEFYFAGGGK